MSIPPLAIVQARMRSTRLPGKVMMPLADGRTLLETAVDTAVSAFGKANVVVATTDDVANGPIVEWCKTHRVACFAWGGFEENVLSRFYHCAHVYRWSPDAVIVRITPDDPLKDAGALRRSAQGVRTWPEIGGEAFTLAMLDAAWVRFKDDPHAREHITHALYPGHPWPPLDTGDGMQWTIDTQDEFDRAFEYSKPIGSSERPKQSTSCIEQAARAI